LIINLSIKSTAFDSNKLIPKKYTCDGENINPPLTIEGTPKEAKTFVLIMDDPDAPSGTFDHWVVWNIPSSTVRIGEHSVPGVEGLNSARENIYHGPCPPSGTHRYFFKVYALDTALSLNVNSSKKDVEKAMQGHVLAKGELVGLYRR
jgi:Raf kinase inhibitor-like YbhB/YbcL family protein